LSDTLDAKAESVWPSEYVLPNDYTKFWDDKPFLKKLAEMEPSLAIGGPVVEHLRIHYWAKLRAIAESDFQLRATMPGMLVAPDKIAVYIGNTHLAVEYFGPAHVSDKLSGETIITVTDYRGDGDLISDIIGMKFQGTGFKLPLAASDLYWNLFLPTSADAITLMMEIGWDLTAENMAFGMNTGGLSLPEDDFARMVNCFFYSAENERLKTRRIQWIDFLPLTITDVDDETEDISVRLWPDMEHVVNHDVRIQFPRPALFENDRLALLNRFREVILTPNITEPQITAWLAQPANQFILKMSLPAVHLLDQRKCVWVSDPSRDAIMPDFFAIRANGYADIVEFKLPELKGAAIVGKMNREAFSAEVRVVRSADAFL
jgi:hypothetical protein